jgi:4-hydroxybenzoate polyprenyltransferase
VGRLHPDPDLDLAAQDRDAEVKLLRLYTTMLRFRVAAMVWLFMLLGAASQDGLSAACVLAAVALGSCYVAATALNDVADEQLDRVNHPVGAGRPLVSGEATAADLRRLSLGAAIVALVAAAPLGAAALALVALSLAIAHTYSLPPLRFSYRTYLAPLVLGVGYVVVPFALGGGADLVLAAALYALFAARIVLKDFRDRAGDARFGRPTLLLRFGKTATCAVSAAALAAGNVLLLAALRPGLVLSLVVGVFVAAIAWMLYELWRAEEGRAEQVAIGLGARMGNGLLICVLGWLVLVDAGAPAEQRSLFALAVAAVFTAGFLSLASRPADVVIGYKG